MLLISRKDLYINFKNTESNMVIVTGISGSGKSALAEKIKEQYNYEIVSMDILFEYLGNHKESQLEKELLMNFKTLYPNWAELNKNRIYNLFFDFVNEYITLNDINIIFDGSQFLRRVNFDKINNQRIILKRTALLVSLRRRNRRNIGYIKEDKHSIREIFKEVYWLYLYDVKNILRWIKDEIYFLINVKRRKLYYE